MARSQIIPRARPSRVVQGTPLEIEAHLKTLKQDERLTLIIPGEEIPASAPVAPAETRLPHAGMPFAEILAPLQEDYEASGMSEEELGEFIDAEIRAYRAERRAKKRERDG